MPVFLGLLGTQLAHELGHAIAAKVHNVKLQFPVFLPSLQLGIYGAITRFLSYPKSRKALFDVSIAGPLLGFLTGAAATAFGIHETMIASPEALALYPAIPAGFFQSSFLFNEILHQFLHITQIAAPIATDSVNGLANGNPPVQTAVDVVSVHPAVAVGAVSMLTNALNFLPIGRLDGGRVAMAVGGRRASSSATFLFLLLQGVSLLTNVSPVNLAWIIAVAVLQRSQDIPPEDDISPVATDDDDNRKGIAWFGRLAALAFCIVLTSAIMLPAVNVVDTTTLIPPGGPYSSI